MNELLPRLSHPSHPEWIALYHEAITICQRNVLADPYPNWGTHIACMPGVPNCWVWDSCFIALYARYLNGQLPALGNLDNLYKHQDKDGFIAMAYKMDLDAVAYGQRINPPLFAWAESDWLRQTGDLSRVQRILPHLVRLFDWYKANRRKPDGLYWFEDSGSTGMDNSPRSGYASERLNGSDICHVDLISQQAYTAESIAWLASLLGEEQLAARFKDERDAILPLIGKHWNERTGFYYDLFYHTSPSQRHNYLNHRTVAAFWPMLAGACTLEQAAQLVRTLLDPEDFLTPHPVATLSRRDPNYHPEGRYWLGGVWAPTNYMVVRALRRYGYYREAREIAVRHLAGMSRVAENPAYGSIWECYAPELDAPATTASNDKLCRPNFVGWSGLGSISMLIEDIMGMEFDATQKRIQWRLGEACAVENLKFAGNMVSLRYNGDKELDVSVTESVDLEIIGSHSSRRYQLHRGTHHIRNPSHDVDSVSRK